MICPKCGSPNTLVMDSRQQKTYNNRRRRKCVDCGCRFGTVEVAELDEVNMTRIRTLMVEQSKPRQYEKIINLMYVKSFMYSEYKKMKGMKENDGNSKVE